MIARSYARVSSSEQTKGMSIDSQTNRHQEYCNMRGIELQSTYKDMGHSAQLKDEDIFHNLTEERFIIYFNLKKRPAFRDMLNDAKTKQFDTLLITRWDRFSRNQAFQELVFIALEKMGIKIIPTDDDTNPLVRRIKGAINQEESDKISLRVHDTMRNKFNQNIYPLARSPFGYYIKKNKGIFIDQKKAAIVKDIFEMASEGSKYKAVCDKHNIAPQIYYNLIKNKTYIGIISYQGKEKKGIHEAIISEEVFNKVNSKKSKV